MITTEQVNKSVNEIADFSAEETKEQYTNKGRTLVKQIDSLSLEDLDLSSKLFELISIYARTEEIRKLIHQDNLEIFQNLAQFYLAVQEKTLDNSEQKELINVKIQILRAIGNLAIDDDEARQRLLDTGVVSNIIKDLDSKPDLNVMKFMTGCLLNISLGYAPMRQFMLKENCVSALMNSVNVLNLKNNEMAVYFGLRQLSNLFDEDEGTKLFAQNYNNLIHLVDIIDFYIKNSGVYDVSILEHTCEILELMLTENENYQVKFVDSQNYLKIINFIRNANDIKERYSDNEKEFTNICTVIERIIVLISSHDKNMVLFDEEDFIGDMLSWLAQNEDLQLKSCSALVLGNLIRSSENSIKAVEFYKLHEKIYKILEIAQDLSIQHAMVGLLKNLSIPAENKETIGKLLFIKLIAPFLEKFTAPPLQYNTIGVLKHLSNRNEHNALAICDEKNSMNGILPIVRLKKAIDKTDNPGIRSEGTRALINVIKAICNKKDNYEKYSQLLKENSATEAVIDLVKQTQFIVLQNEGLIALTVLVLSNNSDIQAIIKALSEEEKETNNEEEADTLTEADANKKIPFYNALKDIVLAESKPYEKEMRFNAVSFITQIYHHVVDNNAPSVREKLIKLIDLLKTKLDEFPEEVLSMLNKLAI